MNHLAGCLGHLSFCRKVITPRHTQRTDYSTRPLNGSAKKCMKVVVVINIDLGIKSTLNCLKRVLYFRKHQYTQGGPQKLYKFKSPYRWPTLNNKKHELFRNSGSKENVVTCEIRITAHVPIHVTKIWQHGKSKRILHLSSQQLLAN